MHYLFAIPIGIIQIGIAWSCLASLYRAVLGDDPFWMTSIESLSFAILYLLLGQLGDFLLTLVNVAKTVNFFGALRVAVLDRIGQLWRMALEKTFQAGFLGVPFFLALAAFSSKVNWRDGLIASGTCLGVALLVDRLIAYLRHVGLLEPPQSQ